MIAEGSVREKRGGGREEKGICNAAGIDWVFLLARAHERAIAVHV